MSGTRVWRHSAGEIELGRRTLLMGVVNVTPDSFSDGGRHPTEGVAVAHGLQLLADGADVLDVGGESTRPGARPVSAEDEARRVVPVVRRLAEAGAAVSVDTTKARVADACLAAGARIVNDVSAARDPGMLGVVARHGAGLVLMHMQGEPRTMQEAPAYGDVVKEVAAFLSERVEAAVAAGVAREAVVVDPGIGFGKTLAHNLALLRGVPDLKRAAGRPVLVGASRKGFLGTLTAENGAVPSPQDRLEATIGAHLAAVALGADAVRVHDVRAHRRALAAADPVLRRSGP
ncbi:MAG TPA: dihydropteroate synthase [Candidatus Thermoplasmatota archaeon]|nr:dihydropteroate synthase [Candidatus Thermoplasmatota archaeon]